MQEKESLGGRLIGWCRCSSPAWSAAALLQTGVVVNWRSSVLISGDFYLTMPRSQTMSRDWSARHQTTSGAITPERLGAFLVDLIRLKKWASYCLKPSAWSGCTQHQKSWKKHTVCMWHHSIWQFEWMSEWMGEGLMPLQHIIGLYQYNK